MFVEGSTGDGCFIEVDEGQGNLYMKRNELEASRKYNISQGGEYNLTIYDWDVGTFGPVLTRGFIVSDPTEGKFVLQRIL